MAGFGGQVRQFNLKTKRQASQFVRKLALEFLTMVVTASPVDSGRYRANHQVMLQGLTGEEILAFDKDGSATISRGAEVIARFRLGQTIYICNNVEYAFALEFRRRKDGKLWSSQAPAGVYRVSWQRLLNWIERNGTGGGL